MPIFHPRRFFHAPGMIPELASLTVNLQNRARVPGISYSETKLLVDVLSQKIRQLLLIDSFWFGYRASVSFFIYHALSPFSTLCFNAKYYHKKAPKSTWELPILLIYLTTSCKARSN